MKKHFILYAILIALLFSATFANASSTSTTKINDLKQKIENLKEKAVADKAKIKEEIASTTADIKDIRQELASAAEIRIGKRLDAQKIKVADVFEKTIQNLKDLITRIESRMAKMTADNIDVSSSTALLEKAKTNVSLAETELTNLENLLAQNIPAVATSTKNTARNTMLKNIKAESDKTKTAIKLAHKSIIDVINSLKPGYRKEQEMASTSVSTEASTSESTTTGN